jgi:hypothetical protein
MLNKELLMRNTGGQQPVALTVGSYRISGPYFYYGYDRGHIGALAPVPFWDNNAHLSTLRYDNQNNRTTCAATDRSVNLTVYISGYQDSPISSGESISGDPFRFTVKVGQTVYLTFDPPLPDIYKKVKQVFTRSRKEGVVNAGEGNAYRVGYTRKGKYHQRHELHCTGGPRWKFSLDYTSRQERGGQCTYRGCGISIFPRLGWRLTRACHLGHIGKYITHWLYRFPSKAPNGGLIRRDHRNLGVTSQLEVSYAA